MGGKGRVPWAKLQEAPGDFILAKYLPDGVTIAQFHHIRVDNVNAILKHWTQRQAAGAIPFRFRKVDKADRLSRRSSGEDNASTGGGTSDIHGNKAQDSDGEFQGDGGGSAEGRPDGKGTGGSAGSPSSVS